MFFACMTLLMLSVFGLNTLERSSEASALADRKEGKNPPLDTKGSNGVVRTLSLYQGLSPRAPLPLGAGQLSVMGVCSEHCRTSGDLPHLHPVVPLLPSCDNQCLPARRSRLVENPWPRTFFCAQSTRDFLADPQLLSHNTGPG